MNETTERFFRDIADRIGHHNIVELHLFPTIRQGGMESAIAVVAAHPELETPEGGMERHVVYTARYRQTLKGPDRGKWEFDVKAEADAPLITVDQVVRGVVQRSGDDVVPERISAEQFAAIVPAPEVAVLEADSTEAALPEAELPETKLPDAELPQAELSETESPDAESPESELPEAAIL